MLTLLTVLLNVAVAKMGAGIGAGIAVIGAGIGIPTVRRKGENILKINENFWLIRINTD